MIQFPAIIKKPVIDDDNSMSFKVETREMSPSEYAIIAGFTNKECYMAVAEVAVDKLDVPDEITEFKGEKSLSERLRNTLYVYWDKVEKDKKNNPFESFRKIKMEQFIQVIKEKIPE